MSSQRTVWPQAGEGFGAAFGMDVHPNIGRLVIAKVEGTSEFTHPTSCRTVTSTGPGWSCL